jgi:hypothetical protein
VPELQFSLFAGRDKVACEGGIGSLLPEQLKKIVKKANIEKTKYLFIF